eukprot:tig00000202_g16616.t1
MNFEEETRETTDEAQATEDAPKDTTDAPRAKDMTVDNFLKCGRADKTIRIDREAAGDSEQKPGNLSIKALEKHIELGKPEFKDVRYTTKVCIDGRGTTAGIHTPGGEISEFLLSLAAFQKLVLGGKDISEERVYKVMKKYIDKYAIPGYKPFYAHTDTHGEHHFAEKAGDHGAHTTDIPAADQRDAMAEKIASDPKNLGCGHLKRTLLKPDEYKTPAKLTKATIKAFYKNLWEDAEEGNGAVKLDVLKGEHEEGDLAKIGAAECGKNRVLTFKPFVPGDGQVFVFHANALKPARELLAKFVCSNKADLGAADSDQCRPADVKAEMEKIFTAGLTSTATALAKFQPHDMISMWRVDAAPYTAADLADAQEAPAVFDFDEADGSGAGAEGAVDLSDALAAAATEHAQNLA